MTVQAEHARTSVEMVEALPADAINDARWDAFVGAIEGGSFCHLAAWREIMTDVLGHECLNLVAMDHNGAWNGVLPIVRVKSVLGHQLISMPFLNYGGPLGSAAAQRALVGHAVAEAGRSGAGAVELRSRMLIPVGARPEYRKVAVLLQLPDSPEVLWEKRFAPKLRSQIRRARKEGMQVRFGPGELESFYEVFSRNMRDLGTPVLSHRFFERIRDRLGDTVVFAAVILRGRPVAAACAFLWKNEVEVTWASSLREFNSRAPNMLLYHAVMQHAIANGIGVFNFGRCTAGGGTHRFKQQWGGQDCPLPWYRWCHGAAPPAASERPILRFASWAWKRIPLPLAARLGPAFARSLP